MIPAEWVSLAIAITTLVLSLVTSLAIASFKSGQANQKITDLEQQLGTKATKEDITSIKESLAEIKGMFVLRLRDLWLTIPAA